MNTLETIEGIIGNRVSFHYDVASDVLYLRLSEKKQVPTLGEETDDGLIELREEATDEVVGVTVVHWLARFGGGSLPDSLAELTRRVEPMTARLAA